ncbi:Dot/Icm T4SS effector Zinc-dependent metalloprotease LegP [Coralliovum pocilloporae]|uniref:Dot/Icm T4SS effector Zinc-dependent metalloprotease LegP n=1 Tax=Coralliovum pocilloporae TaxID=3066369 RepID=UPI003306E9B8
MADNDQYDADNDGMLSGEDVRTGFISGANFTNKPVQYTVVDGEAILEGCIVLGTVEEMEANAAAVRASMAEGSSGQSDQPQRGVAISGDRFRWPDALMPYEIDSNLPNQARVTNAIAHWEQNTNMRFVRRTSANASQYPNYVRFRPGNGCSSSVGMRGGRQNITLASGCSTGNTIHEIGHAFGLWHEQSREDRDQHVTINWSNITSGKSHNFNQHVSDGDDYGAYDFGSIMHYGATAFSKNGQPTITTIPPGTPIGQRTGLSPGDIATIHAMYTTWHNNKRVQRVYSTHDSQNAWAAIEGLGWRKIKTGDKDGVTNCFITVCDAMANNRNVNVYADGSTISRVYLL